MKRLLVLLVGLMFSALALAPILDRSTEPTRRGNATFPLRPERATCAFVWRRTCVPPLQ